MKSTVQSYPIRPEPGNTAWKRVSSRRSSVINWVDIWKRIELCPQTRWTSLIISERILSWCWKCSNNIGLERFDEKIWPTWQMWDCSHEFWCCYRTNFTSWLQFIVIL